jgi:hypothetical protein
MYPYLHSVGEDIIFPQKFVQKSLSLWERWLSVNEDGEGYILIKRVICE